MPVIEVYSTEPGPGRAALEKLSDHVTDVLDIEHGHCWVMWLRQDSDAHFRPEWDGSGPVPPVALVTCKQTYDRPARARLVETIAHELAEISGAPIASVYVALRTVDPSGLWVRGTVWNEGETTA